MNSLFSQLKSWPLWLQINTALIALAIFIGIGAGEFVRKIETSNMLDNLNNQSAHLMTLLAASATSALVKHDKLSLESILLQTRLADPHITATTIRNEKGIVLAHWNRKGALPHPSHSTTQQVKQHGKVLGNIQLVWDLQPSYQEISRQANKFRYILIICIIVITICITLLMHGLTIRPIKAIHQRLIQLAKGNLSEKLQISHSEELTQLSNSVNSLSSALASQKNRDQIYLWQLEREVSNQSSEINSLYNQVKHHALHDPLTQLPNRILFLERLNHSINQAKKFNQKIAVIFIDLDHFKQINDTFGHEVGDFILKQVASRIKACIRSEDTVARQSGDEFVVMLDNIISINNALHAGKHIVSILNKPYRFHKNKINLSASIGVCLFPDDAEASSDLIRLADRAMYQAKQAGRNNCQVYSSDVRTRSTGFTDLVEEVKRASKRNEFYLEYQPIIDINTGWTVGIEALVRWRHPEYGLLPPNRYIPLAEDLGIVTEIDFWVFKTACQQIRHLNLDTPLPIKMAINFSSNNFKDHRLATRLYDTMDELNIDPSVIQLEITENLLRHCDKNVEINIEKLRNVGISFALDSFGAAYSPLAYLNRIPLESIKLRRNIFDSGANLKNLQAVISQANKLGILIVASEIENEKQLNFFRKNYCHYAQGYLFSKPCSAEDIADAMLLAS